MNNNKLALSGSSGEAGPVGSVGSQGMSGATPYTSIKHILEKYNNRFLLDKYKIDEKTMAPIIHIVDNFTSEEHTFKAKSMINIIEDFKIFLNDIITEHRDTVIDKIL